MLTRGRRTSALCLIFGLTITLALLCAPSGYTRQGGGPQDPPPGKALGRGERGDPQGRGGERRSDPCDHEPQGNAHGREKLCPPDGASGGVSRGDFNADGFGDLAIGVPREKGGGFYPEGAVHIIYGSAAGLSAAAGPGAQFWTSEGIESAGGPQLLNTPNLDEFGAALASGRFNADPYSDLAIGVPGEDVGAGCVVGGKAECKERAGAVYVLYGSPGGLAAPGAQFLRQGLDGIADAYEQYDEFGRVLNWGDFDRDGIGDLAVGVPFEDVGDVENAGAVHIIYGSPEGLTGDRDRLWHQDSSGVIDTAESSDLFGLQLAAGDFNGDDADDLAVGAPDEDVGTVSDAGAVQVLYGSPAQGLTSNNNQLWTQDSVGIADQAEADDRFGSALAAGNFNPGPHDDLAIGAAREDVGSIGDAGAVHVIYGSAAGLAEAGDQLWTQNSSGVQDVAEPGDGFGAALAAGDFNGDTLRDLAVGVSGEDLGGISNAGAVHVIYGSPAGVHARFGIQPPPQTVFALFLDQGAATGGLDPAEGDDHFGSALTAWDFGRPGAADLAIGVPGEDVVAELQFGATENVSNAGAVDVIYGVNTAGSDTGVFANPQHWTQESEGIEGRAEQGELFGRALY